MLCTSVLFPLFAPLNGFFCPSRGAVMRSHTAEQRDRYLPTPLAAAFEPKRLRSCGADRPDQTPRVRTVRHQTNMEKCGEVPV